jgi:hypothetical protein
MEQNKKRENRKFNLFLINNLLLVFGCIMTFSGLVMQIGFHMGEHPIAAPGVQTQSIQYDQLRGIDTTKIVCGFNYPDWSTIHKIVIVFFSVLMIYHIYVHWKWFKGVITKHLIAKNQQVIVLTVLFLLVAVTGIGPWLIDLSGGTITSRMHFIEIHDKATLLLIVFLVLHVIKRVKWFTTTYARLKSV